MSPDYQKCPVVGVDELNHTTEYETPDKQFRIVEHVSRSELYEFMYSRVEGYRWVWVLPQLNTSTAIARRLNVVLYPPGSEPSPEYAGLGSHPRTFHDSEPIELERWGNDDD